MGSHWPTKNRIFLRARRGLHMTFREASASPAQEIYEMAHATELLSWDAPCRNIVYKGDARPRLAVFDSARFGAAGNGAGGPQHCTEGGKGGGPGICPLASRASGHWYGLVHLLFCLELSTCSKVLGVLPNNSEPPPA